MNAQFKTLLALSVLGAIPYAQAAEFDDYARVISATPRVEQVNSPREECSTEYRSAAPQQRSMAGSIIGGVAGAILGNQVGQGNGRTAATAVGAITGAIAGDRMDNSRPAEAERAVRNCRIVDRWESRTTGYDVSYEYQGRVYNSIMGYNPGNRVKVQVSVVPQT